METNNIAMETVMDRVTMETIVETGMLPWPLANSLTPSILRCCKSADT